PAMMWPGSSAKLAMRGLEAMTRSAAPAGAWREARVPPAMAAAATRLIRPDVAGRHRHGPWLCEVLSAAPERRAACGCGIVMQWRARQEPAAGAFIARPLRILSRHGRPAGHRVAVTSSRRQP